MPSCGQNCFIREPVGDLPPRPVLVRSTHRVCESCTRSVSDYEHRFCYSCAQPNTTEFFYHHRHCTQQPIVPIAPIAPTANLTNSN